MPRSESEFREKALEEGVPIIQETGLSFLLGLIHRYEIKEILELGTAVAYSSIQMALSSEEITIDTVEKEDAMVREALRNIEEAGLADRIRVHHCPAEEFVTQKTYDLIFVDAAKAQYAHYLEHFLPNLKEDGFMVFDNMLFHGMVYDADHLKNRGTRSMVKKIIKFREEVQKDERFAIMIDDSIGDGILVLKRRAS